MEIGRAVEKTLDYGKRYGVIFDWEKLKVRLVSDKNYRDEEIENWLIQNDLKLGTYTKKQREIFERKMSLAKNLGKKMSIFPSILYLGVSGSVASEYPQKRDDIDLMIICKKDSLWWTRFMVMVWVWMRKIPHRKRGRKEGANEFCFNLWLDENNLEIPRKKQNLQNAMDGIMLKPIINKNDIGERFLGKNAWIGNYLAKGYAGLKKSTKETGSRTGLLTKMINRLFFWGQYLYMRRKMTREMVNINQAFFHPNL